MAYDFAIHPNGDWLFGASRDIQGVTGPELDKQRIRIRCKIPRGSFVYDADDSLGSRLHEVTRRALGADLGAVTGIVTEALEDMEGIVVDDVVATQTDSGISVSISFTHMPDQDESQLGEFSDTDELEADFNTPISEFTFTVE